MLNLFLGLVLGSLWHFCTFIDKRMGNVFALIPSLLQSQLSRQQLDDIILRPLTVICGASSDYWFLENTMCVVENK
jgi:hypothetical protein